MRRGKTYLKSGLKVVESGRGGDVDEFFVNGSTGLQTDRSTKERR
jgi:hypothetical protein